MIFRISGKEQRILKNKYELRLTESIKKFVYSNIPSNEITVTTICKEADVSRGTFYKYYQTVDELLVECIHDEYLNFKSLYKSFSYLDGIVNTVTYINNSIFLKKICVDKGNREILTNVLEFNIKENILSLLSDSGNINSRNNTNLTIYSKVLAYIIVTCVTYGIDGEVVFDIFNGFKMGDISLKELTESNKR